MWFSFFGIWQEISVQGLQFQNNCHNRQMFCAEQQRVIYLSLTWVIRKFVFVYPQEIYLLSILIIMYLLQALTKQEKNLVTLVANLQVHINFCSHFKLHLGSGCPRFPKSSIMWQDIRSHFPRSLSQLHSGTFPDALPRYYFYCTDRSLCTGE